MSPFSVVCILMFTILTSTRALHDGSHHHENENNTDKHAIFDVNGVEGLNSFQAILHFVDLQTENDVPRNLSEHDVSVLVDTWWRRFNYSVLTHQHHEHDQHEHHDEQHSQEDGYSHFKQVSFKIC